MSCTSARTRGASHNKNCQARRRFSRAALALKLKHVCSRSPTKTRPHVSYTLAGWLDHFPVAYLPFSRRPSTLKTCTLARSFPMFCNNQNVFSRLVLLMLRKKTKRAWLLGFGLGAATEVGCVPLTEDFRRPMYMADQGPCSLLFLLLCFLARMVSMNTGRYVRGDAQRVVCFIYTRYMRNEDGGRRRSCYDCYCSYYYFLPGIIVPFVTILNNVQRELQRWPLINIPRKEKKNVVKEKPTKKPST